MNTEQVRQAAQNWSEAGQSRYLVAIGAETDFAGHIRAFEAGMGLLVQAAQELMSDAKLALALPFSPVEKRDTHSYRRALKKYSSSPVFIDLNIFLILVREGHPIEIVMPDQINPFLKNLNKFIVREKKK